MTLGKWIGAVVGVVLLAGGGAMGQLKDFGKKPPEFGNKNNNPSPGGPGYTIDADNPSLAIFPDLRTAPAPDWVKPGLRLTFYSASATIPGSYVGGMVEDPNGKWVDPKTGKNYSMQDNPGAAGHGFEHLDILSVTDDAVAYDLRVYGIEGVNGPVRLISSSGLITVPGAAADWWVNPDVLNKAVGNLNSPGIKVFRMPYKAADKQYQAVWVNMTTASGSISYVIDLEGGLTLHTGSSSSSGPTGVTNLNGVPTNVGGGTMLAQTTFMGMREIQVPWAGTPLPKSLDHVQRLEFKGKSEMTVQDMTVGFPMEARIEIIGRGPDFVQYKMTSKLDFQNGMAPQESTTNALSASNQLVPLCIAPQALAKLHNGQEIDRDPFTKIATFVSFIGQDQSGKQVVTLTEFINDNAVRTDYVYEVNSGIVCAVRMSDPVMHTQNTLYRVR